MTSAGSSAPQRVAAPGCRNWGLWPYWVPPRARSAQARVRSKRRGGKTPVKPHGLSCGRVFWKAARRKLCSPTSVPPSLGGYFKSTREDPAFYSKNSLPGSSLMWRDKKRERERGERERPGANSPIRGPQQPAASEHPLPGPGPPKCSDPKRDSVCPAGFFLSSPRARWLSAASSQLAVPLSTFPRTLLLPRGRDGAWESSKGTARLRAPRPARTSPSPAAAAGEKLCLLCPHRDEFPAGVRDSRLPRLGLSHAPARRVPALPERNWMQRTRRARALTWNVHGQRAARPPGKLLCSEKTETSWREGTLGATPVPARGQSPRRPRPTPCQHPSAPRHARFPRAPRPARAARTHDPQPLALRPHARFPHAPCPRARSTPLRCAPSRALPRAQPLPRPTRTESAASEAPEPPGRPQKTGSDLPLPKSRLLRCLQTAPPWAPNAQGTGRTPHPQHPLLRSPG